MEYFYASYFSDGLAYVSKSDADGNIKYGYIDQRGTLVLPMEYDGAGIVYEYDSEGNGQPGRYRWVRKGVSYGIFENPNYVPPKEESGSIVDDIIGAITGNNTPAPSSPGSQNTQAPANPGGGFPVVPVVIVLVVVVAAIAAVLVLKKKTPAPAVPRAGTPPEVKQGQPQAVKFCPKCGIKVPIDTAYCPKCGKQLENGEG